MRGDHRDSTKTILIPADFSGTAELGCQTVGIKPRSRIGIRPNMVGHDCRITYSRARGL